LNGDGKKQPVIALEDHSKSIAIPLIKSRKPIFLFQKILLHRVSIYDHLFIGNL
jgi:hypothetical protein